MAAAAKNRPAPERPPRRRMFTPPGEEIVVVQPPKHLAHLSGDDLFRALVSDRTEKWYSARGAAECGRTPDTWRSWVSTRYGYNAAVEKAAGKPVPRPKDKMTPTPDGYDSRSPWWYAGTLRTWMIREGLMTREGRFIPYKPTGRTPGSPNRVQRKSPRPMSDEATLVLDEYDKLLARGTTKASARATLASRFKISERAVDRRLTTGRKLRAQQEDLTIEPGMPVAEVANRVRAARALLATDGRRRNEDKVRDTIALRLGVERHEVDRILDSQPAEANVPT